MRRRGIVDNHLISEREAKVKASYEDIMEPALEHCMKGNIKILQIQRITGVNGIKRTVESAVN